MCGIWALFSKSKIKEFSKFYGSFMKISHRGPEFSSFLKIDPCILLGFHRLAIIDTSQKGNQPFHLTRKDGSFCYLICNGEIYNYKELIINYNLECNSKSDCEVILQLYEKFGIEKMTKLLDGEFAYIIFDISKEGDILMYSGRDPIGVRPIFYGYDDNYFCISSEMKGLTDLFNNVLVFPPGKIVKCEKNSFEFITYYDYKYEIFNPMPDLNIIHQEIKNRLTDAVKKRLVTDRPFGCLLSGGLDSSLIVGIIKNLLPQEKFPVFTISLDENSPDLKYAKMVCEFYNLEHHIINISCDDALKSLDETIYAIESWDITTIRASTMQYLIAKYIKEKTNVRVLLVGELSDELCGSYFYFHYAPNGISFHNECIRLVKEVHKFDGLRTDRTMAIHGLEVRLPFSDTNYVDYYFSIDSFLRMPVAGEKIEKYLLRKSFESENILPNEVLWRSKEAFSDGVSKMEKSWFQIIQEHIDKLITDEEYEKGKLKYNFCQPFTKESYYYRKKFCEYFSESENIQKLIPYYWMPKWTNETNDPSARTLKVYKNQ